MDFSWNMSNWGVYVNVVIINQVKNTLNSKNSKDTLVFNFILKNL